MMFQLFSSAFVNKGSIPEKYTCKGMNISPELNWIGQPAGVVSYGLIMDDPDALAGTWVHWVQYHIHATINNIPEGMKPGMGAFGVFGVNSWGKQEYGGPCPPSGSHRYFFKLYALDAPISLKPGADKPELLRAMQGHILEMAEIMGTFTR